MLVDRYPMTPFPRGWYRVLDADQIEPGTLRTVEYLGRPLLVAAHGPQDVKVFDPYCPHLGTHLGHGGQLENGQLTCPFHGWVFDRDGQCVHTPSGDRVKPKDHLRTYPSVVRNGTVMVYWHEDGIDPSWELPEVEDYDEEERWGAFSSQTLFLRTHIQEIAENGPDSVHQATLHRAKELPRADFRASGPVFETLWDAKYEGTQVAVDGEIMQRTTTRQIGLGFAHLSIDVVYDSFEIQRELLVFATPIDGERIEVVLRTRGIRTGDAALDTLIDEQDREMTWAVVSEDIPIWENKVFRSITASQPVGRAVEAASLGKSDEGIIAMRHWARQFYPEGSGI